MLLTTPRVLLRDMIDDDMDALFAVFGDPEVMAAYEGPFSPDDVRAWIARQQRRYADDGFGLLSLIERESGLVIGDCGLTRQVVGDREVLEVGYHLARSAWGRGYASEAARAARDHAFRVLGADEVYSIVRDTNLRSLNVAIRNGMTVRERIVRHYRGVDMPHFAFAIDRATWESVKTTDA